MFTVDVHGQVKNLAEKYRQILILIMPKKLPSFYYFFCE